MQVKVIKDAQVLMPNKEHQNFTFTGEVIPAGNILTGHRAQVDGKRRGQDFKYRIFETTDKKIIYQNTIEPMAIEVTMAADGSQQNKVVSLAPSEAAKSFKIYGAVIGALCGGAYAKYKGLDVKKMAMYAGAGGVLGYITGMAFDHKQVTVTQNK